MALSMFPSTVEAAGLTKTEAIYRWAGTTDTVWKAFDDKVGGIPNVRIFAMLTPAVVKQALQAARVQAPTVAATPARQGGDMAAEVKVQAVEGSETTAHVVAAGTTSTTGAPVGRPLTPVEVMCTTLAWRVARHLLGQPDVDPFAAPAAPPPTAATTHLPLAAAAATPGPPVKRVKFSTILDPTDETKVQDQITKFFNNHCEVTEAEPLRDAEPSLEQISALHDKVITRREEPYSDFAVLTPYGRRAQKAMRLKNWVLQEDGTYRAMDVPGPPELRGLESLPGHPLHAQAHWYQWH